MANAHIISFIQSLSDEEVRSAKEYILKVLGACKANSTESKQLLLFNYITANRDSIISESDISKITGTKNTASLKLSLYEAVAEALTLNTHLNNKDVFNDKNRVVLKLKKKLLFLQLLSRLQNQKRLDTIKHLFNEIIETAKEYELYDLLLEVLSLKKYIIGIRSGVNEFNKINEEIIFYDYCNKAVYYAADCYYRLVLNNTSIKSLSQKELDDFFDVSISQMEIDYKKTRSEEIAYYLHIIRFALCERKKNYMKAIQYCNKLITILKNSKVIYRKDRMGFALDNLSVFYTHIGSYERAVTYAKKAQEHYIKNSFDFIMSKEQEFYACMCDNNKQEQAVICINKLMKHSRSDVGTLLRSKHVYYHACILFQLKNYKYALELLAIPLEIEKDKGRWNISLRILNIMLFIELNKINEASRALESLRKHIERQTKEDEVKSRDVLIVKLLKELEKEGFEFQSENVKVTSMLKKLSKKNTPLSWEHYTAELIPFHQWLEGKKL